MGRAGRTCYDTRGIVVIMTNRENVKKYQGKGNLENI